MGRQAWRDAVPLDAGTDAHALGARVDVDLLQAADVDEEEVLHVAEGRLVVGGGLRRDAEPQALSERDGFGDVAGVGWEGHCGGALIDQQGERRARLVVKRIVGGDDGAVERVGDGGMGGGGEHGKDAGRAARRGRSPEDGLRGGPGILLAEDARTLLRGGSSSPCHRPSPPPKAHSTPSTGSRARACPRRNCWSRPPRASIASCRPTATSWRPPIPRRRYASARAWCASCPPSSASRTGTTSSSSPTT